MNEQIEFLKLIASRLEAAGIPYMMTGSMAMAIYAIPRMTRDIDIVLEIYKKDICSIVSLFQDDCYVDADTINEAISNRSMFNIIHNGWIVKADFIIRKEEEYRKREFERRRKVDLEGLEIYLVTPEDLILSKLVWSEGGISGLQLNDVRQIVSSVKELDWEYMKKWAPILGVEAALNEAQDHV